MLKITVHQMHMLHPTFNSYRIKVEDNNYTVIQIVFKALHNSSDDWLNFACSQNE